MIVAIAIGVLCGLVGGVIGARLYYCFFHSGES